MKFLSWNINGAKKLLTKSNYIDVLWMLKPDIYAFQETKLTEPDQRLNVLGYYSYYSFYKSITSHGGQSGVACFSKIKPRRVFDTFLDESFDTEGRLLVMEFNNFYFVNTYVPNSQDEVELRNTEKSVQRGIYRKTYDKLLLEMICKLNEKKSVIICGDFNAAITRFDMSNNSRWQKDDAGFERDANDRLKTITKSGFIDTYRYLYPNATNSYTHKSNKNKTGTFGRRLDYFFVSDDIKKNIKEADIFPDITGSDHTPIILDIDLNHIKLRHEVTLNLTYEDMLEREKNKSYYASLSDVDLSCAWDSIDWDKVRSHIRHMQAKIAKAALYYDTEKLKRHQYKLVSSLDAKLYAVKSVCDNNGVAGIDKVKWTTSNEKMHAALSLTSKNYTAKPAIMVKRDNDGKLRNIHIDTYYDRAMKALYGFSLAPVNETWADRKSFSGRIGRCVLDASYYICQIFSSPNAPNWAVKTDVKRCYESINHDWIRRHIPLPSRVLSEFLNAGYFYTDKYFDMYEGVGIGCRLSPFLANMALNNLQEYIYDKLNPLKSDDEIDLDNGHMVRFADDIIVSAKSKESAIMIQDIIKDFMRERGLTLSSEKSEIIYIKDGFTFLKRSYKKYGDYLMVAPSKESINNFKNKIYNYIENFTGSKERLIDDLNKRIVGYASHYRMTDAYDIFRELDSYITICLLGLLMKRCPGWSRNRIISEFFIIDEKNRPVYAIKNNPTKRILLMEDTIPIQFNPLPLDFNPFIDYKEYDKKIKHNMIHNITGRYKKIWIRQDGLCYLCGCKINANDQKDVITTNLTRDNDIECMAYIHRRCNKLLYQGIDNDTYDSDNYYQKILKDITKASTSDKCDTYHKYNFTGDTAKVDIPDIIRYGQVPIQTKYRIETMMKHELKRIGIRV